MGLGICRLELGLGRGMGLGLLRLGMGVGLGLGESFLGLANLLVQPVARRLLSATGRAVSVS